MNARKLSIGNSTTDNSIFYVVYKGKSIHSFSGSHDSEVVQGMIAGASLHLAQSSGEPYFVTDDLNNLSMPFRKIEGKYTLVKGFLSFTFKSSVFLDSIQKFFDVIEKNFRFGCVYEKLNGGISRVKIGDYFVPIPPSAEKMEKHLNSSIEDLFEQSHGYDTTLWDSEEFWMTWQNRNGLTEKHQDLSWHENAIYVNRNMFTFEQIVESRLINLINVVLLETDRISIDSFSLISQGMLRPTILSAMERLHFPDSFGEYKITNLFVKTMNRIPYRIKVTDPLIHQILEVGSLGQIYGLSVIDLDDVITADDWLMAIQRGNVFVNFLQENELKPPGAVFEALVGAGDLQSFEYLKTNFKDEADRFVGNAIRSENYEVVDKLLSENFVTDTDYIEKMKKFSLTSVMSDLISQYI